MGEMLYLKDVCISFGSSFSLDRLSFSVAPGEIYGFLGPSGAGKTTTMKLLTGQLRKEKGVIRILGKDISEVIQSDYDRIGILSDTNGLYERMSIENNLKFFARIRGVGGDRVEELLKRMRLFEQRKTAVKKCSRGMRQRAILAAAVLHSPELLFLDEPTSGLDPAAIQEVHKLLRELNRDGTTIFLTTHNMEEADRLCGRIGILNQGRLAAEGVPEDLKLRCARDEIEVVDIRRERRICRKDAEGAELIGGLLRSGELMTIHSKEPDLEEVFIELTGREF